MLNWHCQSTISYQATGHTHSSVRASSPHGRASPGSKTKTCGFLKFPKAPQPTTRQLDNSSALECQQKRYLAKANAVRDPSFGRLFFWKKLTLQGINISTLIRHIWRWFSFPQVGYVNFRGGYLNCNSSAFPRLSAMPPRQASNARASAGRPRWDLKFRWENHGGNPRGNFLWIPGQHSQLVRCESLIFFLTQNFELM